MLQTEMQQPIVETVHLKDSNTCTYALSFIYKTSNIFCLQLNSHPGSESYLTPCLRSLFRCFLCLSNRTSVHTLFIMFLYACNAVLSFFPRRKISPLETTPLGETKSQTKQTEISILPICCASFRGIHQKSKTPQVEEKKEHFPLLAVDFSSCGFLLL